MLGRFLLDAAFGRRWSCDFGAREGATPGWRYGVRALGRARPCAGTWQPARCDTLSEVIPGIVVAILAAFRSYPSCSPGASHVPAGYL